MQCPACHTPVDQSQRFCPKCGALQPAQPETGTDPFVGTVLNNKYRIVKLLGEGGMGAVYVGEQQMGTTLRKVAVKTLHQHLSKDPKIQARFKRECGTVAELEHPNTIHLHDFGQTPEGTLYIVMEYVSGQNLADVIEKGGPLEPVRAERILAQVCGSLQEAHSRGIIHRDLKPENIVLTERAGQKDWVKVLDFGIAKRSGEEDKNEQKLTQQGMVLGTPPYMSPEQFTGQSLTAGSDIYSLGIMAYEMLTGRLPFHANTAWEWATQHMTVSPVPLEQQPQGAAIPERMRHAIMTALAKRPEQRFTSVRDFMDAFSGAVPGGPVDTARVQAHGTGVVVSVAPMSAAEAQRGKTQVGEPLALPPGMMGPPGTPSHGQPAFSGGGPAVPHFSTPSAGNHAFPVAVPPAPGPVHEASGGGNRGLLIGLLVIAVLSVGGIGVYAMSSSSSKSQAGPLVIEAGAPSVFVIEGGAAAVDTTPSPSEDAGSSEVAPLATAIAPRIPTPSVKPDAGKPTAGAGSAGTAGAGGTAGTAGSPGNTGTTGAGNVTPTGTGPDPCALARAAHQKGNAALAAAFKGQCLAKGGNPGF